MSTEGQTISRAKTLGASELKIDDWADEAQHQLLIERIRSERQVHNLEVNFRQHS